MPLLLKDITIHQQNQGRKVAVWLKNIGVTLIKRRRTVINSICIKDASLRVRKRACIRLRIPRNQLDKFKVPFHQIFYHVKWLILLLRLRMKLQISLWKCKERHRWVRLVRSILISIRLSKTKFWGREFAKMGNLATIRCRTEAWNSANQ